MPLNGLRVIELGCLPAAAYMAKLLAEFGAGVVKIEPPGGDPMRAQAPFAGQNPGEPGAPASQETPAPTGAGYAFLAAGKRSVVLEGDAGVRARQLEQLIAGADVLITSDEPSSGGTAYGPALDIAALAARRPGLIICDASWFGRSGPYANWQGSDAVCRALAGLVENVGPADGPPLATPEFQALITAGMSGFIGVMGALYGRARHGGGAALELSVFEACIAHSEYQCADGWLRGAGFPRGGVNRFAPTYPLGVYRAADGWIGVTVVTPAQWHGFCALLGLEHLADRADMATGEQRLAFADALDAMFNERLSQRSMEAWFAEALKRRLPMVPVWGMADIVNNPQFRARGAIVDIKIGDQIAAAPGCPLALTATPPRRGGMVEALGASALPDWPERPAGVAASGAPLAGVTIIDLSMGWAGPLCARFLGDLGADVIKVEACRYPDWWRGVDATEEVFRERLYEKAGRFCALNRNKRGITLDLTHPDGVATLKRLVATADALIENYAADVLPKLGLDYATLRAVNPRLVMTSMCAFGADGPWKQARAYGSTLEQASGLPTVSGRPEDPPTMGHIAYGDATGGLNGAAATLVALLHQLQTGEGQHIDLSQVECLMPMTAPAMIAASLGNTPPRTGSRHPALAPHNCYACRPDPADAAWRVQGVAMPAPTNPPDRALSDQPEPADRSEFAQNKESQSISRSDMIAKSSGALGAKAEGWLVIAVTDDAMWPALANAIGRADLATDESLATARGRKAREDEIDAAINAWCASRTATQAMETLQAAGVAAGRARPALDLYNDPHLAARQYWRIVKRAWIGDFPHSATPFRNMGAAEPPGVRYPAPTLGEHSSDVLRNLPGMTEANIAGLFASDVTGTEALPPRPRSMAAG